jgi:uncharacterized transporter YbjL
MPVFYIGKNFFIFFLKNKENGVKIAVKYFLVLHICIFFVSLQKKIKQQNMDKQRKIIHLHVKKTNEHHYFGSIKALCQNFDKQEIGIVYSSLKTVKLKEKGIYENNKCVIRQGKLITIDKPKTTPDTTEQ